MRRNLHAGKRHSGGFSLDTLSDDELYEIHLATLEVLERTGVFVQDPEAREAFDGAGAVVDAKTGVVRIPPHLVEESIRSAPSKLVLAGRDPKNDFVMENNRVGFTTFGEGIKIIDPETREVRHPTKADAADVARLADYSSEVDVYERALGPRDVPAESAPVHNAEAFMPNTTKHCFIGPMSGYLLKRLVEMAAAVVGGIEELKRRPILSFVTCPVSPLTLAKETCEIIMEGARSGMTVNVLSMAMAGASSPVGLAGTLVNHNAEVLSGIVLSQQTRKASPVIYGSSTTALDLKRAAATVGSPEFGMINAAVARLANYYMLPSFVGGL